VLGSHRDLLRHCDHQGIAWRREEEEKGGLRTGWTRSVHYYYYYDYYSPATEDHTDGDLLPSFRCLLHNGLDGSSTTIGLITERSAL